MASTEEKEAYMEFCQRNLKELPGRPSEIGRMILEWLLKKWGSKVRLNSHGSGHRRGKCTCAQSDYKNGGRGEGEGRLTK